MPKNAVMVCHHPHVRKWIVVFMVLNIKTITYLCLKSEEVFPVISLKTWEKCLVSL